MGPTPRFITTPYSPMHRFSVLLLACLCVILGANAAHGQVYISEFLADNQTTSAIDENGDHSDWLEIWNSGATTVSLNGWYLTDDSSNLRKWQFPVTTPSVLVGPGARILIWCSSKNRKLNAGQLHTNFKLAKNAGSYLALVKSDGLTISHAYNGYPQQTQDIAYGFPTQSGYVTLLPAGANGRAKVPLSTADMPANWNANGFNDSAWTAGAGGFGYDTAATYGTLLGTDLQASMYQVNSTALIRIPFTSSSPSSYTSLRLSMKYDDGYICYLNGTQIASSAAPSPPAWNSSATGDRPGSSTNIYETLTLPSAQNFLVNGTNVLAIQMLNYTNGSTQDTDNQGAANGSRCLCLPFLEGNLANVTFTPSYLITPTPGSTNSAGLTSVGPGISQTTDEAIPRPTGVAGSPNLVITAKVVTTLNPLNANSPVQVKYRINFGSEIAVVMKDDGVAPDVTAGDKIFTGQIPTNTMGVDQMLRWRIEARDTIGALSTDPPFRDSTDNEQYYGTVSADGITTSQLPILHWFVSDTAASRTEGGTRCSLFFQAPNATKPRFYDNVFVGLHGQSSSGFSVAKKSHDFNFNEDNRFEWDGNRKHQRAVNMITDWADKSKVRHCLAYSLFASTGHIASHWAYPIRVQQNGAFWGTYDLVENGDEDFIDRAGLDPMGALYKVYDTLASPTTSGAEKKSGYPETDYSDLAALESGLDTAKTVTARRQYAYDNVDVPSLVNFLATCVLMINNDTGHKNYYVYRDTYGTGEWSLLPWDLDLSFGHTWTTSQNYFNDDLDSQRGFLLGNAAGNRLMDLVTNSSSSTIAPEMAQMFLRRLRTLMDQQLISVNGSNGPLEQRINQYLDLIDPPGAAYLTDADLDLQKWGYWVDGNGASQAAAGADAATHDHGLRKQALRILSSNPNPPYPAANPNAEGLGNTLPAFFPGRRSLLFGGSLTLNGQFIPGPQAATPTGIVIEYIDANPAAGAGEVATQNNQREFFIIRNNSGAYVDMSGWQLKGAVTYTFRGGTVLPPFISGSAVTATGDVHAGRLHMARNPAAFRARVNSPKAGEYRMVMGPYDGQLSARGEAIRLVIPGATEAQDVIIATGNVPANPTAAQTGLRVTELNYDPTAPTAAESSALPGVQASDFEFIELTNTGATTLSLGGATFDKGIDFTFPAGYTLAPGAKCLLVSLQAAFTLRYGSGFNIAGQYEGNLDNSGERLRLLDPVGEEIFDFTYDPKWYPPTNGGGYSLVTRSNSPAWDGYDAPTSWAISATAGGSPGASENGDFSAAYEGWVHDHFTLAEEAVSALVATTSDPETDGDNNLYEYAFGTDPRVVGPRALPKPVVVNVGGTDYGAVTFTRRRKALDLTFIIETNSNPANAGSWSAVDLPVGTPTNLGNGLEAVTYRSDLPLGNTPTFFRVRATKPIPPP